jgi:AraC-like DNA-binding protein
MARGHGRASAPLGRASDGALDPLSDVLRGVRLSGACFFRVEASAPWWAEVPDAGVIGSEILPRARHLVSYHVVTEGRLWAGLADGTDLWAEAGDVVVVPHGDCYALATSPGEVGRQPVAVSRAFFRALAARELPPTIVEGGGGRGVGVVCGFLGCDAAPFNPVLALLPRLLKVSPPPAPARDPLAPLVAYALDEARSGAPGSNGVLLRISELLFVEVARRLAAVLPPAQAGWLAALRDPPVARALGLLHREPSRGWTLQTLARAAGLSRTVLAERFAAVVGQPPIQYLARWRMQLGARRLAEGSAKLRAIALEVGYESEASFSRAFKKATGLSPDAWRRRERDPA